MRERDADKPENAQFLHYELREEREDIFSNALVEQINTSKATLLQRIEDTQREFDDFKMSMLNAGFLFSCAAIILSCVVWFKFRERVQCVGFSVVQWREGYELFVIDEKLCVDYKGSFKSKTEAHEAGIDNILDKKRN